MRTTLRRLVSVAVLVLLVWIVGAVVGIVAGWPAQFGGSGDPNNVVGEFVSRGTAASPPLLPPMVALAALIFLGTSRRWWGTLGVVGICLLAAPTFVGSLGEAFAPFTPDVPRAVLIASGVVGVISSVALLLSGIAELIDRTRVRQRPSRVS